MCCPSIVIISHFNHFWSHLPVLDNPWASRNRNFLKQPKLLHLCIEWAEIYTIFTWFWVFSSPAGTLWYMYSWYMSSQIMITWRNLILFTATKYYVLGLLSLSNLSELNMIFVSFRYSTWLLGHVFWLALNLRVPNCICDGIVLW